MHHLLAKAGAAATGIILSTSLIGGPGLMQALAPTAATAAVTTTESAATIVAAPAGSGTACSTTAPCTIVTALSAARPGGVVELRGGDYGSPLIKGAGGTAQAPVHVRPAPGESPSFYKLQTYVPYTVWSDMTVTRVLYVYPEAHHTTVDRAHLVAAGSFLRGNSTLVRDSLFEGGSGLDAVQIKDGTDITLEHNTIRDYAAAGSDVHVDCVQVFNAAQVRLLRNSISNCSNAGVILSGGGAGIAGIELAGNFIQGCVVVTDTCRGGSAIDLRESTATGVVVRNNTIIDGAARLPVREDLVFDRNIVGFLSDCEAPMTHSIVETWNTGLCVTPTAFAEPVGNRQGSVPVVDRVSGDLHPTDSDAITITPTDAATCTFVTGFDGTPLRQTTAGAAE